MTSHGKPVQSPTSASYARRSGAIECFEAANTTSALPAAAMNASGGWWNGPPDDHRRHLVPERGDDLGVALDDRDDLREEDDAHQRG